MAAADSLHRMWVALLLVVAFPCAAEPDTEALYRKGVQLVEPYLALADKPAADPTTSKGRSDLLEGIGLLSKVVSAKPDNWPAYRVIGKAQQALGNHRAAYDAFKQAYARKSDHPDVGRELVIEAICIGETKEAVGTAQQLSRAHPDDAGLTANVGLALLANNDIGEAKKAAELALKMEPSDPVTKNLINEIAAVKAGRGHASYCPFHVAAEQALESKTNRFLGPSGRTAYSLPCADSYFRECRDEADLLCPNGWNWIDSRSGIMIAVPITRREGLLAMPTRDFLSIECK